MVNNARRYSALSAQRNSEEAIDIVLIESYEKKDTMWDNRDQVKCIPFNPVDKFTIAYIKEKDSGETYRLLKGAPQARVYPFCPFSFPTSMTCTRCTRLTLCPIWKGGGDLTFRILTIASDTADWLHIFREFGLVGRTINRAVGFKAHVFCQHVMDL